jgi:hypothetical protein
MTKLHQRLELSVVVVVLKTGSTLSVHIAVLVVSVFTMAKNGHGTLGVLGHLF